MYRRISVLLASVLTLSLLLAGAALGREEAGFQPGVVNVSGLEEAPSRKVNVSLLTTGLEGASGSTIGPDGALYVTEGESGRISRIDPQTGTITTFASGLPKRIIPLGGAIDVAFIGETAYALVTVVGNDVGGSDVVGIYRVDNPNSFTVIADIGEFSSQNVPTNTQIDLPTGLQYALEPYHDGFLVTDGHHNRVLQVTLDGEVTELIAFDNIVPTGLALSGNAVYMAEAGPVPHLPEQGKVVTFELPSPTVTDVASGARLLVDVEFGPDHRLFALSQGDWSGPDVGAPAEPNTGALVEANEDGSFTVIADGLNQPTSLEFIGNTAYVVTLAGEVWSIEMQAAEEEVKLVTAKVSADLVRPGRVLMSARGNHWIYDSVPPLNGPNEEVNPLDGLLTALSACGMYIYEAVGREQYIPVNHLSSTVTGELDGRGAVAGAVVSPRVRAFHVTMNLEGPTVEQAAMMAEAFSQRCPIYTTLARSAPIHVTNVVMGVAQEPISTEADPIVEHDAMDEPELQLSKPSAGGVMFGFGRSVMSARGNHWIFDSVPPIHGPNEEVNPLDAFVGALPACGIMIYEAASKENDITLNGIRADVEADLDPRGVAGFDVNPRIRAFRVTFHLDGPSAEEAEVLADEFSRRCPIYTTYERSAPIEVMNEIAQ